MSDTDTEEFTSVPGTTEPVEDTRPPIPIEVKPEPKQFLQYEPVAVGRREIKRPSLTIQMVNTRASHFYFKRVLQLMRSLGKYR